jgi:CDP-paratose 2-epimerase
MTFPEKVLKKMDWLKENHNTKLNVVLEDIQDYDKLEEVVRDVDVIYHTAAQVAVTTTSVTTPILDFEINALGTIKALEAARNANTDPALIFTSTNKVYGKIRK